MYTIVLVISRILAFPIRVIWNLLGWQFVGDVKFMQQMPKMIVVGGPHTSAWDYFVAWGFIVHVLRRPRVMIKKEAFNGVQGVILRLGGAIPIDRSHSHNFVDGAVEALKSHDRIVYALTPEGTRKKTDYWRSGFYHIAYGADVPIVMACVNYQEKKLYVSPPLVLTGDIDADMVKIRAFFRPRAYGRYPERASDIRLRIEDEKQEDAEVA